MLKLRTTPQTTFTLVQGAILRLALLGLAGYVAWRVRFVIVIILLAVILTFMVDPVVSYACRLRPQWVRRPSWRFFATLTVFLTLIAVSVGIVLWLSAPFQAQLDDLQLRMGDYQAFVSKHVSGLQKWYDRLPASMRESVEGQPVKDLTSYAFGQVQHVIEGTIGWISHLWELILIPILSFYFCLDSRSLKRELMILLPYRRVREALYILRHTSRIMRDYVVAQLVLCIIAGVTVGVGLWALGVRYSLVLGVLAGITRAVPIVGPIFSAIPITILSMTLSIETGISVLVFFCFLHLIESKVLLPELVGHSMKLHPAVILIVLLVGAEFFGILGMFLAAPVAAIIRMLLNLYLVEPQVRQRKAAVAGGGNLALSSDEFGDELRKVS